MAVVSEGLPQNPAGRCMLQTKHLPSQQIRYFNPIILLIVHSSPPHYHDLFLQCTCFSKKRTESNKEAISSRATESCEEQQIQVEYGEKKTAHQDINTKIQKILCRKSMLLLVAGSDHFMKNNTETRCHLTRLHKTGFALYWCQDKMSLYFFALYCTSNTERAVKCMYVAMKSGLKTLSRGCVVRILFRTVEGQFSGILGDTVFSFNPHRKRRQVLQTLFIII